MSEDTKRLFILLGELLYRGTATDYSAVRALTQGAGEAELEGVLKSATELRGRLCEADYVGYDERMSKWIQEHDVHGVTWERHVGEISDRLADVILESWTQLPATLPAVAAYRVAYQRMRFTSEDLNASREVRTVLLPALSDDVNEADKCGLQCFLMTKKYVMDHRESMLEHVAKIPAPDVLLGDPWHLAVESGRKIPDELILGVLDAICEATQDDGENSEDSDLEDSPSLHTILLSLRDALAAGDDEAGILDEDTSADTQEGQEDAVVGTYPIPDDYQRDKWIYEQRKARKTNPAIIAELASKAGWTPLYSEDSIRDAIKRYCLFHHLEVPMGRRGRPSTKTPETPETP